MAPSVPHQGVRRTRVEDATMKPRGAHPMTMHTISRRRFLGSVGIATAGLLVAGHAAAGAPPKESGLSSEGLLVGHAGFQPRTTMPLPHDELPGFLSREQLAGHHAEYARLVARLHDVEDALRRGGDAHDY